MGTGIIGRALAYDEAGIDLDSSPSCIGGVLTYLEKGH